MRKRGIVFDPDSLFDTLNTLRKETESPDFWQRQDAASVLKKIRALEKRLEQLSGVEELIGEIEAHFDLFEEFADSEVLEELEVLLKDLAKKVEKLWVQTLFRGKYDDRDAVLSLHAGAGGVDAMDWTEMLLRMYTRWAESHGYDVELVDVSEGEEAGIKSATLIIRGPYAYGNLRSEKGVHRLVRISPFDANKRRHTSFALVEVIPYFDDDIDVEINPDDIKMETFRSGGKGGQHQNKRESGVRLTHIPTGISVIVTTERSQHQNRAKAMKILKARLYEYYERKRREEMAKLKGEHVSAEWGNQIRSYILQPFQLVKDHRTGYETANVNAVLEGDIDDFILAYLRWESEGR